MLTITMVTLIVMDIRLDTDFTRMEFIQSTRRVETENTQTVN